MHESTNGLGMLEPPTSISAPAETPGDSPASVAIDLPCEKCRYNLRGMPVDGLCPECATPIAATIGAPWRSSPKSYRCGLYLAAAVMAGVLLVTLLAVAVDLVLFITATVAAGLSLVAALVAIPFNIMAAIALTGRASRDPNDPTNTIARRCTRWLLCVGGIGAFMLMVCVPIDAPWAPPVLGILFWIVALAALVLAPAVLALHLAVVARWLNAPPLARRATTLAVGHLLAMVFILLTPRLFPRPPGVWWSATTMAEWVAATTMQVLIAAWCVFLSAFALVARQRQ